MDIQKMKKKSCTHGCIVLLLFVLHNESIKYFFHIKANEVIRTEQRYSRKLIQRQTLQITNSLKLLSHPEPEFGGKEL